MALDPQPSPAQVTTTGKAVTIVLKTAFKKRHVPKKWQVAQTAQLDKDNGKEGTKGIRHINIMCPLGKTFFNMLWKTQTRHYYYFPMATHHTEDVNRRS